MYILRVELPQQGIEQPHSHDDICMLRHGPELPIIVTVSYRFESVQFYRLEDQTIYIVIVVFTEDD